MKNFLSFIICQNIAKVAKGKTMHTCPLTTLTSTTLRLSLYVLAIVCVVELTSLIVLLCCIRRCRDIASLLLSLQKKLLWIKHDVTRGREKRVRGRRHLPFHNFVILNKMSECEQHCLAVFYDQLCDIRDCYCHTRLRLNITQIDWVNLLLPSTNKR